MNYFAFIQELLQKSGKKIFLVVENIRSAYNVGAMFRTADGAGIFGIIVVGYTPDPNNLKIPKTALGSEQVIPWAKVETTEELFSTAEKLGVCQVGLEVTERSVDLFTWQIPDSPVFLYVGNEVTGLSLFLMTHLENFVALPMNGIKVSLNVAEASSIALYELLRKTLHN